MANTGNTTTASMHDQTFDSEKAAPQESNTDDTSNVISDSTKKVGDSGAPDGGAAAWLVVLGAWCCSFSSPGWINSMNFASTVAFLRANHDALPPGVGAFQQYYETGPLKGYSSSTIAWIPSLQIFFLFALGPVIGILFDIYGPRTLIIIGTLFHVFGLMMASLAKDYYQFILAQGICSAIGVALLYTPGKWNPIPAALDDFD